MHRTIILVLIGALLLTSCDWMENGGATTPPSDGESGAGTPQEFIDALDAALTSGDKVVHTTVAISGQEARQPPEPYSANELWIYGVEDRMRNHFQIDVNEAGAQTPQTIFVRHGNRTYSRSANGQVSVHEGLPTRTCPLVESTPEVHHVTGIFCAVFTPQTSEVKEINAHVERGVEYQGHSTVALVYEAHNELPEGATPEPERAPDLTVSRFYIDSDTYMPLGWTVEMQDEVEGFSVQMTADYTNELVSRDELPADFFNPDWLDEAEETP